MLEISNLSKTYDGDVKALSDISLSIAPGMFGLLGPNGAGKSTLMRTIATLQNADEGSIMFGDCDVFKQPADLRAQLGYLPQEFGVYPGFSAFKLLDHLATLKGLTDVPARREQINALLHQTNLYDARNRAVSKFSGGMKQRFGVAQALLGDPKLIIVDEPTAGLDPEERHRFLNLLSEIGENAVVLLSTHIVEDVSVLCRRLAIIDKGRIIATGLPKEMTAAMNGKVWAKDINRQDAAHYEKDFNVLSSQLSVGELHMRIFSDVCPEDGFGQVKPTLEDVYFAVLKKAGEDV